MTNFDSAKWAGEFFEVASRTLERDGVLDAHLILIEPETRGIGYMPISTDVAEHGALLEKVRAKVREHPRIHAVAMLGVIADPRPGDPGELLIICIETAADRRDFAARVVHLEDHLAVGPLNEIALMDGVPISGFFDAPAD